MTLVLTFEYIVPDKNSLVSSTLGIVDQGQGHSRILKFSPFTKIQTFKSYIPALGHDRKFLIKCVCSSDNTSNIHNS